MVRIKNKQKTKQHKTFQYIWILLKCHLLYRFQVWNLCSHFCTVRVTLLIWLHGPNLTYGVLTLHVKRKSAVVVVFFPLGKNSAAKRFLALGSNMQERTGVWRKHARVNALRMGLQCYICCYVQFCILCPRLKLSGVEDCSYIFLSVFLSQWFKLWFCPFGDVLFGLVQVG